MVFLSSLPAKIHYASWNTIAVISTKYFQTFDNVKWARRWKIKLMKECKKKDDNK
jgi:hypothetical protein